MRGDKQVSRRKLLRRAGSAAVLITAAAIPAMAQPHKVAQASAGYQDSPHDGQVCQDCKHFTTPAACALVEGAISPQGWCKLYSAKG